MSTSAKVLLGAVVIVVVGILARPAELAPPPELVEDDEPPPRQPEDAPTDLPPLRRTLLVHALDMATLEARTEPIRLPTALRTAVASTDGRLVAAVVGPEEAVDLDVVAYRTRDLSPRLRVRGDTRRVHPLLVAPEGDALLWVGGTTRAPELRREAFDGAAGVVALTGARLAAVVEVPEEDGRVEERVLLADLARGALLSETPLPAAAAGATTVVWDVPDGLGSAGGAEGSADLRVERMVVVHPDGRALTTVPLASGLAATTPIEEDVSELAARPRTGMLTPDGTAVIIGGPDAAGEPLPLLRLPVGGTAPAVGPATTGAVVGHSVDGRLALVVEDRPRTTGGGGGVRLLSTDALATVGRLDGIGRITDAGFTADGHVGVTRRVGAEWLLTVYDPSTLTIVAERSFGLIHRAFPRAGIVIEGIGG